MISVNYLSQQLGLKISCLFKRNPARKAGFLFPTGSFGLTFPKFKNFGKVSLRKLVWKSWSGKVTLEKLVWESYFGKVNLEKLVWKKVILGGSISEKVSLYSE